ncbi:MAG: homoserine O-succinyltransferase [Terriglobales bacterium]
MPLIIEGDRMPAHWKGKGSSPAQPVKQREAGAERVRIAFINNMPDPALEDTEAQFFSLLETAAGNVPVSVKLYSLPGVPRGDRGAEHLKNFYSGIAGLWDSQFDAVIMTGTEPRSANLRDEPYWSAMGEVLDWAESNTISTVLSCLAAHAAVLHRDGIPRHPLGDKQFGVFESTKLGDHELTNHAAPLMRFPHSRWNEVREDELIACGYEVLTRSADAGVDLFVKKKKKSLFVNFQGHPEYTERTLLKEYRRDIKRFLRRERETYPSMPHGYFDAAATKLLSEFQRKALAHPREEQMAHFPEAAVVDVLENTWESSATCIYRNWLQYVVERKTEAPGVALARGRRRALANHELA